MIHHQEIQYMLYGHQRRMGEKDQRGYSKKKKKKLKSSQISEKMHLQF